MSGMNDLARIDTEAVTPSLEEGYSPAELHMMDQFASQYAFGQPIGQALKASGYGTINVAKGFELLQIAYVQARIDAVREWIKGRLVDDINTLLMQLDQDRAFAYQMENPSAAVSATNSKAKLLGLLDPDKEKRVPSKITIEWSSEGAEDVRETVIDAQPLPDQGG